MRGISIGSLLALAALAAPDMARADAILLTSALPEGIAGEPYLAYLDAEGGDPSTYQWDVQDLPPGLTFDSGKRGKISGVPTSLGSFEVLVSVSDGGGASAASLVLQVSPYGYLKTRDLATATLGALYGEALHVDGGTPPVVFKITAGSLPQGLALSPSGSIDGTVDGSPLGPHLFTVEADDAVGHIGQANFSIEVVAPKAQQQPTSQEHIVDKTGGGCSSSGDLPGWSGLAALVALGGSLTARRRTARTRRWPDPSESGPR